MNKFKRLRARAMARLHGCDQPITGIFFDAQFQIGEVVGESVGRNNFDGVTAGEQVHRQLSRADLRSCDDSGQWHKIVLPRRSLAARLRRSVELRLAVLLQNLNGAVQGSRQGCNLLLGAAKIPTINRLVHPRNHHGCVPGVLSGA